MTEVLLFARSNSPFLPTEITVFVENKDDNNNISKQPATNQLNRLNMEK